MDYIPGQIHESLQKEFYYLVNMDFVWSNCKGKRYKDFHMVSDWGDFTESLELKRGDVISVRFFYVSDKNYHCYLEKIIRGNREFVHKSESNISKGFLEANLHPGNGWLFSDVTKTVERDKKIESICCETYF